MSFPNRILGFRIGWKDLGERGYDYHNDSRSNLRHKYCNTIVHIGKEEGKLFYFCPKCLIKMKDPSNTEPDNKSPELDTSLSIKDPAYRNIL